MSLCLQSFPDSFWSEKLIELIATCVLNSTTLGFDVTDVEVAENLPLKVCSFAVTLDSCSMLINYV